ncbi:MAG: helix-turn-helix domain-containing protein [Microbacterium sp.]
MNALRETLDLAAVDDGARARRAGDRDGDARRVTERPLTRVVAAMRDDHRLVAHADRMLAPVIAESRGRGRPARRARRPPRAPSNRTAAAEVAHLSRNRLYQRIALLEDLLGIDFDDGEQVAALHLAVLTHRLHVDG